MIVGILGCTSVKNKYEYKKSYSYKKQLSLLNEMAKPYGMQITAPTGGDKTPFSEEFYNHMVEIILSMNKIDGLKVEFHYEPDSGFIIPVGTIVKSMFDSVGLSPDSVTYKVDSIKLSPDSVTKNRHIRG